MSTTNKKKKAKSLLADEDLNPKNVKWRVTMMLDLDIIETFKKQAQEKGIGYQTLINQALREHLEGSESFEKRLEKLEKAVFDKRAG
jgi:uncharacterized protein (DUF4415 family)